MQHETPKKRGRPATREATPKVLLERKRALESYYRRRDNLPTPERNKENPQERRRKQAQAKAKSRQHRMDWLAEYKLQQQCADCDRTYDKSWHLDFDHLPSAAKSFNLSKCGGRSWAMIEAELAKCEVVCALCHRDRTVVRGRALRSTQSRG